MRTTLLLAVTLIASACGGGSGGGPAPSPSPSPTPAALLCRPAGQWNVTLTAGVGSCSMSTTLDPFVLQGTTAAGFSIGGTPAAVVNSAGACLLTNTQVFTSQGTDGNVQPGDSVTVGRHYTLTTAGVAGGSASAADTTHPCTQAFSASGSGP